MVAEGFSFASRRRADGHYLAQLMVNGEAEIDMASLDPKRYGSWMTTEYAARKNEECYDHVFILHHPDEEREACRPLRTSPSYDREKAAGAQFGQVNGWERPNYYAPLGFDDQRRARSAGAAGSGVCGARGAGDPQDCRSHQCVGLHQAPAPRAGATAFLDRFTCNKLPGVGRINLTYALTEHGTCGPSIRSSG